MDLGWFLPRKPAWLRPGCNQYLLGAGSGLSFGLRLNTAVLGLSPDQAPLGQRIELARHMSPRRGAGVWWRWPRASVLALCGRWHGHESPLAEPVLAEAGSVTSSLLHTSKGPVALMSAFLGLSQARGPLDAVTTASPLLKIGTCARDFCASFLAFTPVPESVSDPC